MAKTLNQRMGDLEICENEHWEATRAHLKAQSVILESVCVPICAITPALIPVIIKNLQTLEKEEHIQNGHPMMLQELRNALILFQKLIG